MDKIKNIWENIKIKVIAAVQPVVTDKYFWAGTVLGGTLGAYITWSDSVQTVFETVK